jgi:hypothetical protein
VFTECRLGGWVSNLLERYRRLSDDQRRRALASFIHRVTIDARDKFLDGRIELARQCNETVHRVSGFIAGHDLSSEDFVAGLLKNPRWAAELEASFSGAAE